MTSKKVNLRKQSRSFLRKPWNLLQSLRCMSHPPFLVEMLPVVVAHWCPLAVLQPLHIFALGKTPVVNEANSISKGGNLTSRIRGVGVL